MTDELATTTLLFDESEVKKYKRGNTRSDGKVFWEYNKACRNGERWVSPDSFDQYLKKVKEASRNRYLFDKEKVLKQSRTWRADNLVKYRLNNQKYYAANLSKMLAKQKSWAAANKEKIRAYQKQWRSKNASKIGKYHQNYTKNRRANDPIFCLIARIRARLYKALKAKAFKKGGKTSLCLGCSAPFLKAWVEKQFSTGMSWTDRDLWHLDHLVPIHLGRTPEELYLLNHYTNLRPLWKLENLCKNRTLPESIPEYIHPAIQKIYQQARNQQNT